MGKCDRDTWEIIQNAFNEAEGFFNSREFAQAIEKFKFFLTVDGLPLSFRMIAHFSLAQSLVKDFGKDDDRVLDTVSKRTWSEAASNFDMCAHLYDYFFDSRQKSFPRFKVMRNQAKERLDYIVFRKGGGVKYFNGHWATDNSLCADFRPFEGYSEMYTVEKR